MRLVKLKIHYMLELYIGPVGSHLFLFLMFIHSFDFASVA